MPCQKGSYHVCEKVILFPPAPMHNLISILFFVSLVFHGVCLIVFFFFCCYTRGRGHFSNMTSLLHTKNESAIFVYLFIYLLLPGFLPSEFILSIVQCGCRKTPPLTSL